MKNFSYLGLFLLFIGLAACSNNTNSKAIEAAADAQLTGVYTNGNFYRRQVEVVEKFVRRKIGRATPV